jgi:serpin B
MKKIFKSILAGVLALLMAALAGCVNPSVSPEPEKTEAPAQSDKPAQTVTGYSVAAPAKQEFAQSPTTLVSETGEVDWDAYTALQTVWNAEREARLEAAKTEPDMSFFTKELFSALLEENEGNLVFSPANIYIALAMLTETVDGETRSEILRALGAADMPSLRNEVAALLKAETNDDGVTKSLLANSLWLSNKIRFNADTLSRIAEVYEAASFWGDPADAGFTQALRDWLNENTGGLLKDAADKVEMKENTILAIASTIYFKCAWAEKYAKDMTEKLTFHGKSGDKETDFMHKTIEGSYYRGEGFTAVQDRLKDGAGSMWLLLPDEGISVEEMMKSEGFDFLFNEKIPVEGRYIINVTAPKLDVSSDMKLDGALKKMGVVTCFDDTGRADFTPLVTELDGPTYVSEITHAARVKTDEEGVEAAAFTVIMVANDSAPLFDGVLDFTLDRPFAFVITGQAAPLFVGIVNDMD